MKTRNRILIVLAALVSVVILAAVTIFVFFAHVEGYSLLWPDRHVKKALDHVDTDGDYIICRTTTTADYEWCLAEPSEYDESGTYVYIKGPRPFTYIHGLNPGEEFELFSTDLYLVRENRYVFYVTGREEVYNEYCDEMAVQYTVSGWDILYPICHGTVTGLLKSPRYLYESDLAVYPHSGS